MATLPPKPSPGDPITADLIGRIMDVVRENTLRSGLEIVVNSDSSGTTLRLAKQADSGGRRGGFSAADLLPLQVYLNGTTETDGTLFSVWPGACNNLVPMMYDDDAGDTYPLDYTDEETGEPDPPKTTLNFGGDNTSYVYLRCGNQSDGEEYPGTDDTTEEFPTIISSTEEKFSDDDYGYLLIAKATVEPESGAVTLVRLNSGSVWTERFKCGDATPQYWWSGR